MDQDTSFCFCDIQGKTPEMDFFGKVLESLVPHDTLNPRFQTEFHPEPKVDYVVMLYAQELRDTIKIWWSVEGNSRVEANFWNEEPAI